MVGTWNMRKAVRERTDTRVPPRLPANVRIRVHMASFLSHDMIALLILHVNAFVGLDR